MDLNFIWFLLLALFWGGSFVGIKVVISEVPPVFGAGLRVALALLILAVIFRFSGKKVKVPLRVKWKIWLTGLFAQGIPFCFLFWGEKSISPGLAGIFNGTVPIWAFLIGTFLSSDSERLPLKKFLGLLVGFMGMGIIFWPALKFGRTSAEMWGSLAVLIMAISYGIASIMNRRLLTSADKVDFRANIYHQHWASVVFILVVSLVFEKWPPLSQVISSPSLVVAIVYLSLFSTAIAWLMYYHLIREWGAVRASTVTYIVPIMALFWDYVFFHQIPGPYEIVGALAILSGIFLLQF